VPQWFLCCLIKCVTFWTEIKCTFVQQRDFNVTGIHLQYFWFITFVWIFCAYPVCVCVCVSACVCMCICMLCVCVCMYMCVCMCACVHAWVCPYQCFYYQKSFALIALINSHTMWRAAWKGCESHMRPVSRRLPTPDLHDKLSVPCNRCFLRGRGLALTQCLQRTLFCKRGICSTQPVLWSSVHSATHSYFPLNLNNH
jgi:hypothetical protein